MEELSIAQVSLLALFVLLAGGFVSLVIWTTFMQPISPTTKDRMDWDFHSCEQMREADWPEEEIASMMRKPGNYYDKDYEND